MKFERGESFDTIYMELNGPWLDMLAAKKPPVKVCRCLPCFRMPDAKRLCLRCGCKILRRAQKEVK